MDYLSFSMENHVYRLKNDFKLVKADSQKFSTFYAIYRDCNLDFLPSFQSIKDEVEQCPYSFWITKKDTILILDHVYHLQQFSSSPPTVI